MADITKTEDLKEEVLEEAKTAPEETAGAAETDPYDEEEYDKTKVPKWYVVHTYSGHENKVKVNIETLAENRGMQDRILEVVVPTEDVVEIKDGQRKIKKKKMFPGYIIVKMVHDTDTWYLVRNTQGVTGFVGGDSKHPLPLSDEEVARMGIEKVKINLNVEKGDTVRVISGPFESFMGVVQDLNEDKQIVNVSVSMFGSRDTNVELEFGQVEKI